MEQFLRGLLHDLLQRCVALRDRLTAIPADSDINGHHVMAYQFAERLRLRTEQLLEDPSLVEPALLPSHLRTLQGLERGTRLVEAYLLPFLERYGDHDRRLTRFCRRLAQQIKWPLAEPLVVAASTQYYWTLAVFGLICVSATEGSTLLGLPDLCHELGHILLEHQRATLLGTFEQEVRAHFRRELQRVNTNQRPPKYRQLYMLLLNQWADPWLIEFASDMIGAYLAGPAFGWQHIRLCSGRGQAAYHPAMGEEATHPADEARLRGSIAVLEEMGAADDGLRLAAVWTNYLSVTGETRPPDYDSCYPESLLRSLALHVMAGCRALGLRGFDQHTGAADSIVALLQEAWERFLAEPETYSAWEQPALHTLWRDLGFGV